MAGGWPRIARTRCKLARTCCGGDALACAAIALRELPRTRVPTHAYAYALTHARPLVCCGSAARAEHLLREVSELKAQHAAETAAFQRNFDELAAEVARRRAVTALPVVEVASVRGTSSDTHTAGRDGVARESTAPAKKAAGGSKRAQSARGKENS
jgi:hypothetical protein